MVLMLANMEKPQKQTSAKKSVVMSPDQESNRHHVAAVPVGSEVVFDAENLQLNLWQSDANSENKSKSFNLDQLHRMQES